MRIMTIIGTRPEIIKMAPVINELDKFHEHILVHTGQHYDYNMDRIFFRDLELREPDHNFELRKLSEIAQIATILREGEKLIAHYSPQLVMVQGDTNTTMTGALLGSKSKVSVGHVEAGLRSFDKTMPEELNRTIADHLSTYLFAPTKISKRNLRNENLKKGVYVVGNTVVDALLMNLKLAEKKATIIKRLDVNKPYFILTLHRQENVDNQMRLARILDALELVAHKFEYPIIFPAHPRCVKRLREFRLEKNLCRNKFLKMIEPVGYLDFLMLEKNAALVMTDSGGVQEETCILKVPCVTLRYNTERPETLLVCSNMLAGTEPKKILSCVKKMLECKRRWKNPFGDGTTAKKIVGIINALG